MQVQSLTEEAKASKEAIDEGEKRLREQEEEVLRLKGGVEEWAKKFAQVGSQHHRH